MCLWVVRPLSFKVVITGKSVIAFNQRSDGEVAPQGKANTDSLAFEKNLVEEHIFVRTANRHRCAGIRVPRQTGDSGSRNSATKAGRNLWEMPCPDVTSGPQLMTLSDCLTKTQVSAKRKRNV